MEGVNLQSPLPLDGHLEFSTEVLRVLVEDWTGPGGTTPLQSYPGGSHTGDMHSLFLMQE